jgi:hypothetical protein
VVGKDGGRLGRGHRCQMPGKCSAGGQIRVRNRQAEARRASRSATTKRCDGCRGLGDDDMHGKRFALGSGFGFGRERRGSISPLGSGWPAKATPTTPSISDAHPSLSKPGARAQALGKDSFHKVYQTMP